MSPRLQVLIALLATMIGAGACVEPSRSEAPPNARVIGALLPFTGDRASVAESAEQTLIMVGEAIDDAGGVGGRRIYIDARDTRSDTDTAIEQARALVEDVGIDALVGPDESEAVHRLEATFAERRVLEITTTVTAAPRRTIPGQLIFQVIAPLASFNASLALQIEAAAPGVPITVLHVDDGYGALFAASLVCTLRARGRDVAAVVPFALDDAALDDAVRTAMAAEAPVAVVAGYALSSAALLESAEALGWHPRWFLAPSLRDEQLLANLAPGILADAQGVASSVSPDFERFAELYRARWDGSSPPPFAAYYYDAIALIALAMEAAIFATGAAEPDGGAIGARMQGVASPPGQIVAWDELGRALELVREGRDVDYVGVSGAVNLDARGEPPSAVVERFRVVEDRFEDAGSDIPRPFDQCR